MQEKTKTVWSMAALAFLPVAAVTFGVLWVSVIAIGEPTFATPIFQFDSGALPLFAGIALSFLIAVPIAISSPKTRRRGEKAVSPPRLIQADNGCQTPGSSRA
ncbi:MAG: hypothetical protein ACE360_16610 [Hyphomicrobiales bacterium]